MIIRDKAKKPSSSNFPSTLRRSLGFLPTILLKAIIEDKIIDKKENISQFPKYFSFQTVCIYIDISHFFDNNIDSNEYKEEKNSEKSEKQINMNNNNLNKKKLKIDFDEEISPEFYYFCINRYYEKLISIITNHGGDVIFQGNGVFAIWPPDKKEKEKDDDSSSYINLEEKNKLEEKNINMYLRAIQCAIEIQKNSIMEIKHGCSFISKIGCSIGECKFIIFQGLYNKYDYIVLGDALTGACNSVMKGKNKKDIIIDNKIYDYINQYINYKEFYIDGIKYCSIIDLKNKDNPIKNNKATMNIIKNNFSLEEISMKSYEINKFNNDIIFYLFQRNIFDEKWLKEIKNVTLVYTRLKMNKKDLDNPSKLQQIYLLLQEICLKNGGNIHKITTDNKGILILLTFGILSSSSGCNELKGAVSSIELNIRLKKMNVIPFIGITSGKLFCGLCGTVGNRREYSILGGSLVNAFLSMETAEIMYGDKKSGNDNILLDEKTMNMIDSKIPCKFWKKYRSTLGFDFNLFVPLKISNLIHIHRENNLFPLIGCHLTFSDNEEYKLDEDIVREDNIIYFEESILKDYIRTLNEYKEKKSKIKIISVTGPVGCGKTMLLSKSLKTFFQMNPKLREMLCNSNYEDEYPFIFSSNLTFTMNNNIFLENNFKEYRGLQIILRDIFSILYKEEKCTKETINIIIKNNCGKYAELLQKIFHINDLMINNLEEFQNIKQNTKFEKDDFPNINSLIYDLFYKYKQFLESIYEEKLSKYFCDIPLIIIIEDFDTCDENTKDFIRYYLTKEENPFLIITAKSLPIFPCFNFLPQKEKDPFYEYNDETIIKKYKLCPYDTKEELSTFVISILYELRKANIISVSDELIQFLLNKTFNGIPQFIKELILSLYDNNYIFIPKHSKELVADERFQQMIKYNDFTELKIPDIIEKKVGAIIDNYLDNLDIYILKLASVIGNIFDLTKLKQAVLLDNSANSTMNIIKDNCNNFIYEKLLALEENYMIEILYDLNIKKKYVICKFSVPFLREILYQRTPSEYRNQIHYIIGRLVNVNNLIKTNDKIKYIDEMMELGILQKHLQYSQISIHDNFLNGKLSTIQLNGDNYLNINNLKTLIIRIICAKIKSIKINDDKNNMIKSGYIYKKSDGKITWEYRYFVLTTNRVLYYYTEEDYKERNQTPLGIFYLQNLFDVKLMTDGYTGGRKNIIFLLVNEWIKKGEVMKPRIYYLSVEDKDEAYRWVISFSILKIKAFYENYCSGFGYVTFPIYSVNKKEFNVKQKKFKFKLPVKVGYKKIIFSKRNALKRRSIYSPYLSLGKIENRYSSMDFEKYLVKQFLLYIKFLVTFSLSTFFNNIQIGFSKNPEEYEERKSPSLKTLPHFTFANPLFYSEIMDKEIEEAKKISCQIEEITNQYKSDLKSNGLYSSNRSEYSEQQKENFKKSYLHHEKIKFLKVESIKRIKNYQNKKMVKHGKFYLNRDDELSFCDLEEPEIDKEDYLKYLDYTDFDGKLKEQYKRVDSNSLSKKSLEDKSQKVKTKFSSNTKFDDLEYIEKILESAPSTNKKDGISSLLFNEKKSKEKELKLLEEEDSSSEESNSEPRKRKSNVADKNHNNLIINELKKESSKNNKKIEDNKKLENKDNKNKKSPRNKKSNDKSKNKSKNKSKSPNKKNENKNQKKEIDNKNQRKEKEIKQKQNIKVISSGSEKEKNTKSNKSRDSKEIIREREKLNTAVELNTISKDSKKPINDIENESNNFTLSKADFGDLVIKMSNNLNTDTKNTKKIFATTRQKNINKLEYIFNDETIKEEKNSKDTVSLKNTSARFVFTLNGDMEKNEEESKENEKVESQEKSENSLSTKKEIPQEKIIKNENSKKKKEEENEKENINENISSSSHKKEKEHIIHGSNMIRELSVNSLSTIDNNLESTKFINGRNVDSLNILFELNTGGRGRGRRKSNITSGHFRKNLLNDMISFSSSFSNVFNNNNTRRNSNFNSNFYRCNSTKFINDQFGFNNSKVLNHLKNLNIEKNDDTKKSQEDSLGLVNKLKNLKVSLENEKSFSNMLKNIKTANKNNKKNKKYIDNNLSRNKTPTNKSSLNSNGMNTASTKSTGSNFYYPDVYYINQNNNLHTKTYKSTVFSELKKRNKKQLK